MNCAPFTFQCACLAWAARSMAAARRLLRRSTTCSRTPAGRSLPVAKMRDDTSRSFQGHGGNVDPWPLEVAELRMRLRSGTEVRVPLPAVRQVLEHLLPKRGIHPAAPPAARHFLTEDGQCLA